MVVGILVQIQIHHLEGVVVKVAVKDIDISGFFDTNISFQN